jgi:hypothetical protein
MSSERVTRLARSTGKTTMRNLLAVGDSPVTFGHNQSSRGSAAIGVCDDSIGRRDAALARGSSGRMQILSALVSVGSLR